MNPEYFVKCLMEQGIVLSDEQIAQFALYCQLLQEWNQKINLTAIDDQEGIYLKHFWDSLTLSRGADLNAIQTLCDVGSGAGFPSLPLKIVYPHLQITIIDSLKKRLRFLEVLTEALGMEQVKLVHGRAEDLGQDDHYRAFFDLATARAVAKLSVLSEYCLPLVKKGGLFIAMKGDRGAEELDEARRAVQTLGGEISDQITFSLPNQGGERHLSVIRKVRHTPKKYPRQAGMPRRKPIA